MTNDAFVTLLRHATVLIEMDGQRVLVDPMLDPAGAREAVPHSVSLRRNPLVDLPSDYATLLSGLDAVLVTHMHEDHADAAGLAWLARAGARVLCQPEDIAALAQYEIADVQAVRDEGARIGSVSVARTGGEHGSGELARMLAPVSGFVLVDVGGEHVIYVAGDTVWCEPMRAALTEHQPTAIVVNAGGARLQMGEPITMTPADVVMVARAAPDAQVIAVHMDAINHCVDTREVLAAHLTDAGLTNVHVPADGERVRLSAA